ncbi:TlpA family protein disulfide reductase [Pararcticibacter amylolyticus]|uniref:Thioredoxin domain-containing protein n=1 Tax=Pararcticibacter amylolyticus TaxID=2173175 RepID=A0A2U2PD31_9SPHI|nr:TlpA disulfide reductase family protein [Pararcticibacter amylolyticus]PWG79295.1 hypothetical protein DDR33_17385 [Pararcticibacter amylolyticus]
MKRSCLYKAVFFVVVLLVSLNGRSALGQTMFRVSYYPDYFSTTVVPFSNPELPHIDLPVSRRAGREFSFVVPDTLLSTGYVALQWDDPARGSAGNGVRVYFTEPGDSIIVTLPEEGRDLSFSGRGGAGYRLQDSLYQRRFDLARLSNMAFEGQISARALAVIKADAAALKGYYDLRVLSSKIRSGMIKRDSVLMEDPALTVPESHLSRNYPLYLLERARIFNSSGNRPEDLSSFVVQHYTGQLKDKILTVYAKTQLFSMEDSTRSGIMREIADSGYVRMLGTLFTPLKKGSRAFPFSLPDENGKYLEMDSLRGKVVFIDFWFTGCTGCAQYYRDVLSPVEHYFSGNKDVVFVSISVDKDKLTWLKSVHGTGTSEKKYTGNGAVNLYTDGMGSRHPVVKHYRVAAFPRPLLIGRSGKIYTSDEIRLRRGGAESLIREIKEALKEGVDR